jgi:hypothetical protein
MRPKLATLLLGILIALPAWGQSSPGSSSFRWLTAPKDAELLERINKSFSDLLKPDDPAKVQPYEPMLHKSIAQVGVFRSAALIVMLQCDTKDCSDGEYFQPFNMDLSTGKITDLDTGFYDWKFKQFARFENTATPDIVFAYDSCWDCEVNFLLGSLRYDGAEGVWRVRLWNDKEPGIYMGGDTDAVPEDADEGDYYADCLHRIMSFDGNTYDKVAIRCASINSNTRKVFAEWTTVYEIKDGHPLATEIKDPRRRAAISAALCAIQKDPVLCPSHSSKSASSPAAH